MMTSLDWGTITVVASLVVAGAAGVLGSILRIKAHDMKAIDLRFDHLTATIAELKQFDRCGTKEHAAIRQHISDEMNELYKRMERHTQFHLDASIIPTKE